MEDVTYKLLAFSLPWPCCIFNHDELPDMAVPLLIPRKGALHPSCRCCLCCVLSSGHFIFHQCHCSDAKSCQTTLKWLFSPHSACVTHSVEQTRTQPQVSQTSLTDPSSTPREAFISDVKWRSHHHPAAYLDQHVMTFLCHIHELDLLLKLGNRQFYFIEITLGQMTFTLMRVAWSSFRHVAGVCHRKLGGHIKLPYVIFPKCQLFSA